MDHFQNESLSSQVDEMMIADAIRATMLPGASKNFYLIEEPWTMLEEPWRCQWYDKRTRSLCEVYPVGEPYSDDKYAMFTVYQEDLELVRNYVFMMDQYHFVDKEEDALTDD